MRNFGQTNIEIGPDGFSPFRIMFGRSLWLPGISDGSLLTDDEAPKNDWIGKHFKLQEKTMVELRKAEADRKLKAALKERIQPLMNTGYEKGDKIIFLDKNDKWEGLATVKATEWNS